MFVFLHDWWTSLQLNHLEQTFKIFRYFNITLKFKGKFDGKKNNNKWKTQAHIQFYALLLLSDMNWEVAYSTLCTGKKKQNFFFFFF